MQPIAAHHPQAPEGTRPAHGRHGMTCACVNCTRERATRPPALCSCIGPTAYRDPTSNGEPACLKCGRPTIPTAA